MLTLIKSTYENLEKTPVCPSMELGDLVNSLPSEPPQSGCSFDEILEETRTKIAPAITHWQHPKFFAYFPSTISHPTVLADMFATAFHSPSFTWNASPAHTEIEFVVVDWVAKMLKLPECYQLANQGGGTISASVSDSFHLTVHAAKLRKLQQLNLTLDHPDAQKLSA